MLRSRQPTRRSPPIAGGALDGARPDADRGRRQPPPRRSWRGPPSRAGPGVVILPDVRGLHPYYEELALRFAEHGIDALAIDWFGRTGAGRPPRRGVRVHAARAATTWAGIAADIAAGVAALREQAAATAGAARRVHARVLHGRADVVPGRHAGARAGGGRSGSTARSSARGATTRRRRWTSRRRSRRRCWACSAAPTRAITGRCRSRRSTRRSTPPASAPPARHLPGAPHSFFDRKAAEFADASAAAWAETLAFIERDPRARRRPAPARAVRIQRRRSRRAEDGRNRPTARRRAARRPGHRSKGRRDGRVRSRLLAPTEARGRLTPTNPSQPMSDPPIDRR